MARTLRFNRPGVFYHVMARGNARQATFQGPGDLERYLRLLDLASQKFGTEVHAYCLMPNHVHLLVRNLEARLPHFMHWLHGTYAEHFNFSHDRVGHLFQGRYKSCPIFTNDYLFEVGRYIHMNPVEAGLARRPQDYPWSSFRQYLGLAPAGALRCEVLLTPFLPPEQRGDRSHFHAFTCARRPGIAGHDIAGPVEASQQQSNSVPKESQPRESGLMESSPERRFDLFRRITAEAFGHDGDMLVTSRRNPRLGHPRATLMLILREWTPMTNAEIAASMGLRTPGGVHKALARLRNRMKKDARLRSRVEEVSSAVSGSARTVHVSRD